MPDKRLGKLYLYRMADETKVKRKGLPKRKSLVYMDNSRTAKRKKWERKNHPTIRL